MRPQAQGRGGLGSKKQDSKEQTISGEAYAFGEAGVGAEQSFEAISGEANNFGEADALGKGRAKQSKRIGPSGS